MNDRDMYYNSYGYGGFTPMNQIPSQMPGQMPNMMMTQQMPGQMGTSSYANSQFNDMNERVNRLERQVKRLDQRLTRLETPYANASQFHSNEPDNNMYMM